MSSKDNTTNNNFSNINIGNNKTMNLYEMLSQKDMSALLDTLKLCTKLDERIGAKDKEDITQTLNSIKNLNIENPSDIPLIKRKLKYVIDILESNR